MKLDFNAIENPWTYRLFWFVSVAWFILPAWVGLLGAEQVDRWVVVPHVRFLQFFSPPLVDRWPGPIHGGLAHAHRALFSIFYGLLGWVCVRLVWHQFQDWSLRIWWILIYWVFCVGFVQTVTLLLMHFRVITG